MKKLSVFELIPGLGLSVILILSLLGCDDLRKKKHFEGPIKVPPSFVGFNIDFPINELEAGVNSILKDVLIDDVIDLNKKGDQLFIKVVKNGNLDLALRQDRVYASIPLNVKVAIKKKVMGITFSNEDSPITFSGYLQTQATATLDSAWNFSLLCREMNMEWVDEPSIDILGLNIDLGKTMQKALDQNEDKILFELCGAINNSIDFRNTLSKIWSDIQKPIRIAKKPIYAWLYTRPDALGAELLPMVRDTLKIHVEYKGDIHITLNKDQKRHIHDLPTKGKTLNDQSTILAYIQVEIPVNQLESLALNSVKGKTLSFQDYSAKVSNIKLSTEKQNLKATILLTDGLNGELIVKGKPELTKDMKLTVKDFEYEINSEDQITQAADWISHSMAESYIENMLFFDVDVFFKNLDSLANAGISKSRLGDKIKTNLDFNEISSYQQRIENDTLKWIFYLEGTGGLSLKKDVFSKKPD